MKLECPEQLLEDEQNLIEIEEDNIQFYVKSIEVREEDVLYSGAAVIDGERFFGFAISVDLVEMPSEVNFKNLFNAEWEYYDLEF